MRRLREVHTRHGLSPRQFQLLELVDGRAPIGQRELGQTMDVDPSILVTLLNPLESEGLLFRRRDANDRRCHLVTLTAKGERRLAAAATAQRQAEDELFAALGDGEREHLHQLLVALKDGLAPDCPAAQNSDCG